MPPCSPPPQEESSGGELGLVCRKGVVGQAPPDAMLGGQVRPAFAYTNTAFIVKPHRPLKNEK